MEQDLTITGTGVLNATGGDSPDTSASGSGIGIDGYIAPAKLTITGGVTVNATGGNSPYSSGGIGVSAGTGNVEINGATLHAVSGTSASNSFANAINVSSFTYNRLSGGTLTIINSTVTAVGGSNVSMLGGNGIYVDNDLIISDSTVTATGGNSSANNGGVGIHG